MNRQLVTRQGVDATHERLDEASPADLSEDGEIFDSADVDGLPSFRQILIFSKAFKAGG
jgi:hypothetical protein